MSTDDFEKKLERQPMRAVPAAWRAQILREAVVAVSDRRNLAQDNRRSEPAAAVWWRELLRPHPLAWASLAAAWVTIAILHTATPAAPMLVAQQTPSSREAMQRFTEQRRELAVLLDFSTETAAPQKTKSSGPHSELTTPPASA